MHIYLGVTCFHCVFVSSAGSAQSTLLQPVVWLTIALATAICIVPVLAFRFLKVDLKPQLADTVRKEHAACSRESIASVSTRLPSSSL